SRPLDLYYHLGDLERQRMFPIDPRVDRTHVTLSSSSRVNITRRDEFRKEIAERDGKTWVLTGDDEELFDAVHLVPCSRVDWYISTYTRHRSQGPAGSDMIENINDVRSGLILTNAVHRLLSKDVTFLPTPNFAMNTTDIDLNASPTEKRYTPHFFRHYVSPTIQSSSGALLQSSCGPIYPPAILFDAIYASAVLHHFGTESLKDGITVAWQHTFHPGRHMHLDAEYNSITNTREQASDQPDLFDMLMTLPYAMVPRDKIQAALREEEDKARVVEFRRVQEKVNVWLKDVP
ncbi:hypothetical protein CPB84DRAFT_1686627, partial [Gymnopilus junonius]